MLVTAVNSKNDNQPLLSYYGGTMVRFSLYRYIVQRG
jgi:hypothetical protein